MGKILANNICFIPPELCTIHVWYMTFNSIICNSIALMLLLLVYCITLTTRVPWYNEDKQLPENTLHSIMLHTRSKLTELQIIWTPCSS